MEPLFSKGSVHQLSTWLYQHARERAAALTKESFQRADVASLAESIAAELAERAAVPQLGPTEDLAPCGVQDAGRGGAVVTYSIPYSGGRHDMFFVQPSVVKLGLAGAIDRRNQLVLEYTSPNRNAAEVRARLDRDLTGIRAALDQLRTDLSGLKAALRAQLLRDVEKRHSELATTDSFAAALGMTKKSR